MRSQHDSGTRVQAMPVRRSTAIAIALIAAFTAGCSAGDVESSSASSAAAGTAFPNDKKAYDYFTGKGFTSIQAAAIVGNLDQESGINPTIFQQNGGPGRGIAQWSAGGRWDRDPGDNVVAFAAARGVSPWLLDTQLDFIWYELTTISYFGLSTLRAATDLTTAVIDFERDYEGCNIASQCDLDSRLNYARAVFAAFGSTGGGGPDPGTPQGVLHPSASSALCLDVAGKQNANGAAVVVATCDGSSSQSWTFGGGAIRVFGTKCLDAPSGNTANGTKLQIWDCAGGPNPNQTWARQGTHLQWTGRGKCADLTDGRVATGTPIQTWACIDGNRNQDW